MPQFVYPTGALVGRPLEFFDDYWLEYYRPLAISSFPKILPYRANSLKKYPPPKESQDGVFEPIAPHPRSPAEHDLQDNCGPKKAVTIAVPPDAIIPDQVFKDSQCNEQKSSAALSDWFNLQPVQHPVPDLADATKQGAQHPSNEPKSNELKSEKASKDKSAVTQWTLNQLVVNSLNPSVVESEADEYLRYINHPLNLPLVVSTADPPHPNSEFLAYIQSNSPDTVTQMQSAEDDIADFKEFVDVGDDPLTVTDADTPKKRYKVYRQWLKGRSLFKQQRADV